MGVFRIKLGVILVILAMVVVSACAPGAEPTPTPWPGVNRPPVISSLTAAKLSLLPSSASSPSIIEIRCVASDPDGDTISYEWSTTGGKFSGAGDVVSWVAPEQLGSYDVKVTVRDSKGSSSVASVTIRVVSNQDPEILSLVADPPVVSPQGESTITCVARDPDNDVLTYLWEASEGSVTGVGDVVTWMAPDRGGEFTITVTVSDGKGGQNTAQVSVEVPIAQRTVTLNPLSSETGTVSSKGEKDTSQLKAGDNDKNVGYHAFFSFDITQLQGKKIKDAKLTFTTNNVFGEPFSKELGVGLGGLNLLRVRGAQGQVPDYDIHGEQLTNAIQVMWEPPTVIDVTPEVTSALLGPGIIIHVQFEASFVLKTNGNHLVDYINWNLVTLTVTYEE
jgi:hypothetical protein